MTEIVEWIVESFDHTTQSLVKQKFDSLSEAQEVAKHLTSQHKNSMINVQKSVKKLLVE